MPKYIIEVFGWNTGDRESTSYKYKIVCNINKYTHTHTKQSLRHHNTAIAAQWASTGMSGTTQVLEPCEANPPGAGQITRRRATQILRIEIAETWSSTMTLHCHARQEQLGICFPSLPIDVTAGWAASPVDTRPPFNSWVGTCAHTHTYAHTQIF